MKENIWDYIIDDKYNEPRIRFPQSNSDFDYSEISKHKMNWDVVYIENNGDIKKYYAVMIPGYNHSVGSKSDNIYVYPRDENPNKDNLIPFYGDPVLYGIVFEPKRHWRCKYDETSMNQSSKCYITRNGKKLYTVLGRNIDYCLAKAQILIAKIQEHTVEFNTIDYEKSLLGKIIEYKGELAKVVRLCDNCCFIVESVLSDRFKNGEKDLKLDYLEDYDINWYPDSKDDELEG